MTDRELKQCLIAITIACVLAVAVVVAEYFYDNEQGKILPFQQRH